MMQQEEKYRSWSGELRYWRIILVPGYQVSKSYGLLFGELWVYSSF